MRQLAAVSAAMLGLLFFSASGSEAGWSLHDVMEAPPVVFIEITPTQPSFRTGERAIFTVRLLTSFRGEPELQWHVDALFRESGAEAPGSLQILPSTDRLSWTVTTSPLVRPGRSELIVVASIESKRIVDEMNAVVQQLSQERLERLAVLLKQSASVDGSLRRILATGRQAENVQRIIFQNRAVISQKSETVTVLSGSVAEKP